MKLLTHPHPETRAPDTAPSLAPSTTSINTPFTAPRLPHQLLNAINNSTASRIALDTLEYPIASASRRSLS